MTHLDLFSGIGGFTIAAERVGITTIGFSEIDPYASKILKRHWPHVPNYGDIANVTRQAMADTNSRLSNQPHDKIQARRNASDSGGATGSFVGSLVDLVTGGFPCQPFSCAGKRRGTSDDRHLWPEMLRVIDEARPTWVLGENVPGIIGMELDRVLSDLEIIGYACWPVVVPACAVDARHRRDRVWIVAYAEGNGRNQWGAECAGQFGGTASNGAGSSVSDAERVNGHDAGYGTSEIRRQRFTPSGLWGDTANWQPEPAVGRVAHGVPHRSHRLKGLGNAIAPQVAEIFLRGMVIEFQKAKV